MKRYLFFAYRQWAVTIFNNVNSSEHEFVLMSNKNLCIRDFIDVIAPNVIFFYGWSWMVPDDIVDNYTCLCLHPSTLPKYRGGSPIQNQIIAGETMSSVSIFKMTKEVDAGPIYCQLPMSLSGKLDDILHKIIYLGSAATTKFISDYESNIVVFKEQNHKEATFCERRPSEDSEIKLNDFLKYDAKYFFNKVRSLQPPYPECYIKCKKGKILLKEISYE